MPRWQKGERPSQRGVRTEAANSLRMIRILKILIAHSDSNHKLAQSDIIEFLSKDKNTNFRCSEKTLSNSLRELIREVNPKYCTNDNRDDFVIRYNGWESGSGDIPQKLTGLYYKPRIEVSEARAIADGIGLTDTLTIEQKKKLMKKLRDEYPRIDFSISDKISVFSVDDNEETEKNTQIIVRAANECRQITFHFGGYDKDGNIVPRTARNGKPRLYNAVPYYVVAYGGRRYMLCSFIKSNGTYADNVSIYRVDLMSDITVTNKHGRMISEMNEFANTNAHEYMKRHPDMTYGRPVTVTLKVKAEYYTLIHDSFGESYSFKSHIDNEYDKIEVKTSEKGIIDLCLTYPDRVEIIRPYTFRKKLADRAEELFNMYTGK